MAREARGRAQVREWLGLFTNKDPCDVPLGGAVVQENIQCLVPGQLNVRGGLRPASYTNGTTASTNEIVSMVPFRTQFGDAIVYETNDGSVKIGRTPSV